ncbi:bifunctional [glutamate--ammonia ligase]-adenylyl-L-tyrosine phosphorylase/[glutamate--ammonia-ligase] adenylyltransferase [Aliidiomarina sp. Khilg15.8]
MQPMHISGTKLASPLSEEATRHWEKLLEKDSYFAQLDDAEQDYVLWLLGISDFIAWVLGHYGKDAHQAITSDLPHDYASPLSQALAEAADETRAMAVVRRFRHIELARLAANDLSGELPLTEFMQANSALADALIEQSLSWLTDHYAPRWGKALSESGESLPLIVMAMGKLGGQELNFSSDIDLIFCFPQQGETEGGRQSLEHGVYFTRIGQALIKLLGQQTIDGQAFRVDMRLRPFGQSGPMATSFSALEDYYQEQGRNWERYAMVKARFLNAGPHWGDELFQLLRPFVFRRYLDYSAIEALRKMKLLINQEARRQGVNGNIKLGLGGIREIEFIAQTFQLIRGGREKDLQTRSLLAALHTCGELNLLDTSAVEELEAAYLCLRKVEHVLQQLRDEQTQRLPDNDADKARLALVCGFADYDSLLEHIQAHMARVQAHFLTVIGGEEEMKGDDDSELALLWQDLLDDETALDVLQEAGVSEPEDWWNEIKTFRQEVRRRTPGTRGRELLAHLVPALVEGSINQGGSKRLLGRLFSVLQKIASRTTYLELLANNKGARQQLVSLCKGSPWIAHQLERYPHLLDELIDPTQLYDLPELTSYRAEVGEFMARIPLDDMEAQVEALRQAKQSFQLKVAAADVSEGVQLMRVSDHLTYLAEAVIEQVVWMAWQQLTERHGVPPGRDQSNTGFAVIAYGKLGGLELGYGSDLDLVFVCDDIPDVQTDGPRPLDAQKFYMRLAQRVLHLFTTRTMTGVLYEVDMRLRPSGNAGLLVIQLNTYAEYLERDAWTWELQALVRARMVFGHQGMRERFLAVRETRLQAKRDEKELLEDIVKMREKMRDHIWKQHAERHDIKQMPGGMTDIEFITQYLVLAHSHAHKSLTEFTDNVRILHAAYSEQLISESEYEALVHAYKVYRFENHRLALAERAGLSKYPFTEERKQVESLWQRLLLDKLGSG